MKGLHRRVGCVGAAAVASLILVTPASAIPIGYDSFAGTVVNFDGLSGAPSLGAGEILGAQYAAVGVMFGVPNYAAYAATGFLATSTSLNSDPTWFGSIRTGEAGRAGPRHEHRLLVAAVQGRAVHGRVCGEFVHAASVFRRRLA